MPTASAMSRKETASAPRSTNSASAACLIFSLVGRPSRIRANSINERSFVHLWTITVNSREVKRQATGHSILQLNIERRKINPTLMDNPGWLRPRIRRRRSGGGALFFLATGKGGWISEELASWPGQPPLVQKYGRMHHGMGRCGR